MNKNNLVPVKFLTDWDPIDEGQFGSVYKAKHNGYRETVAVKKLKGNVSQGLKELISEAEKMASASNPYVIRLYGILEDNAKPLPGIVMEYMSYGSLFSLMEKVNPIPWPLKFRIIHQVTLGMNWLHNLPTPLLHLDLKTKNVLLTEDLHIKISDFGLSKYTRGTSNYTHEDCEGVGGTLQYMPPEAFQAGYQPGPSTDVYSFAILSAVVLRGEDPYPVDKSILIRELVPLGQRPCLKVLENEKSVKYLHEAAEFTQRCWDNDKLKRPLFNECCTNWEWFFSAFALYEIRQAVRDVQNKMDSSMPSGKTPNASYTGDTSSVNTKDMSEMVHKLATMNFSERPHVLLESVPVRTTPNGQSQHARVNPETLKQGPTQGAVGSNYIPQPTYYSGHAMNFPYVPSQHSGIHLRTPMGSHNRPQYPGPHPSMFQNFSGYPFAPTHFYVPQPLQPNPATIHISNSKNFQIGDNSIMNVTDNGAYHNMSTIRSRYPTSISPQQKQTTRGYSNMPAKGVSSAQPCKQETSNKSQQQSHTHPVQTRTEDNSSNANNTQVSHGNQSTTEDPTMKDPGQ
ncbi:receptor-interacting serine/threonine-protein kinase 3 [Hyla sarda]|uniref:receptor-interacting serine/threonine-protein kinase 3 n=1 Tax=Hyla sarda TaxID=327740 RepID=UPI0024C36F82|nr:receptor-interacting serine/threonine-protein kinase 3 [Hyla sarda]XP_056384150.1 receptor-interacting serine/threonine-protein kinase 3 [Hyla sarda]XP_056384158.1 receptor-interacting serine/threonine-protein kinase 3 [Hyla sarda]